MCFIPGAPKAPKVPEAPPPPSEVAAGVSAGRISRQRQIAQGISGRSSTILTGVMGASGGLTKRTLGG